SQHVLTFECQRKAQLSAVNLLSRVRPVALARRISSSDPSTKWGKATSGSTAEVPRPDPTACRTSTTFGAGYHGAGSCAPNRYQAVPHARAVGAGNFPGNSESS